MINELSFLVVGLGIGATAGILFTVSLIYSKLGKKNKEIGKLKALLTIREILTPVAIGLAKSVLDPFFETLIKSSGEKKKDGIKSKGKNNIH